MTPTKGGTKAAAKAPSKKAARPASLYHVFEESTGGTLRPVGDYEGKTVNAAVDAFLGSNDGGHDDLREKVRSGKATLVVVPDRNYSVVSAESETVVKTKIKVT